MFFLSLGRIIKFSFQDIVRNIWLSLITIMILILTLFSVNLLLAVRAISSAAVGTVKAKVDINLYLRTTAEHDKIMALKAVISALSDVKEVSYISQDEALVTFKAEHQSDPQIIEALRELDKNPLTPSLVIKPTNVDNFDQLINELNKIDDPIIESRNFEDNKLMLAKINNITQKVSDAGMVVSLIFMLITLLVIYNTVRVAIYTHRNEIGIMRLVGASHWFIRGPYLVSSVIYALMSTLFVIIVFFLFLGLLQPYLETFFAGYDFNIISYFISSFWSIFGLEFLIAAIINTLASLVAVSKYSHI
jgi:cell division transport system permease protein